MTIRPRRCYFLSILAALALTNALCVSANAQRAPIPETEVVPEPDRQVLSEAVRSNQGNAAQPDLAVLTTDGGSSPSAILGNTWTGGGTTNNWSDNGNWGGSQPGYGTITFSGSTRTTNTIDQNYSMNIILWSGTSAWTLNQANSAQLSLFDFGGAQAKIENQSSGLVTINAPIRFAATAGNNWAELNAVNGDITFGSSGTLTVDGSAVSDVRLYGSGHVVTFNNTVSAAGKDFGIATSGTGSTVNIGGSFTADNFSLMNNGVLNLNSGGNLNSTAIRLGADYVGSNNINNAQGATFNLTNATGGQTFAGTINAGSGNTSDALVVNSQNTSGTNSLTGSLFLDSNLAITQSSGGTLTLSGSTIDIKNKTLSFRGSGGNINVTSAITNSTAGGQLVVGTNGTAASGGTVTLSASNTYSGDTFVRNGTLAFTGSGNLTNSTIRLGSTSGSSVDASVNLTGASGGVNLTTTINPVSTSGSGTLSINSQNTSGTNTLSGHLGLDRNLTISQTAGGELDITQARAGGAGTTTGTDIKSFTLLLSGAGTSSKIVFSGDIYNSTGNGTVTIGNNTAGAVTATLSGNNSYSGFTKIDTTSVLNINSATALGTSILQMTGNGSINNTSGSSLTETNANTIQLSGGNLTFLGTSDLSFGSNSVTLSGASRSITTNAGTLTVGAISNGTGTTTTAFSKGGAGTLTVTGNSTYTAATSITGGTLKIDNNASTTAGQISGTSGITINNGGTLLLSGSNTVTNRVSNSAGITIAGGGTFNSGGLAEGTRPTNSASASGAAGMGALTLTSTSSSSYGMIDFTNGNSSTLAFSSLSGGDGAYVKILAWTGTAGSDNSATTNDRLLFSSDPGLSPTQLANWQFYDDSGAAYGTGALEIAYGNMWEIVPIPEGSTGTTAALALLLLGFHQRHRIARLVRRR